MARISQSVDLLLVALTRWVEGPADDRLGSCKVAGEILFEFLGSNLLTLVEALKRAFDDQLGFIFSLIIEEAIKKMVARDRAVDLGLFVVVI